jgi:thiamine biosynthesis lipoprotein
MTREAEVHERFACFGSPCAASLIGAGEMRSARARASLVRREMEAWHHDFSRFQRDSELSRVNADPQREVPVSRLMARFAQAVVLAGSVTGGLVDATLVEEIESAGYAGDLRERLPLATALSLAPPRKAAAPAVSPGWHQIEVNLARPAIKRPPGVKLDSGGLAKGLFADVQAERLASEPSFAVNCGGDLAIGGTEGRLRQIRVESPFDGSTLHTFESRRTGVATSGVGRRSWLDGDGRPAHHLLDPSTGRPAFTGVVQVTALAASALTAEIRAKAALLSGPIAAARWLPDGGVIVLDDGSHRVLDPPPTVTLSELSRYSRAALARAREAACDPNGSSTGQAGERSSQCQLPR